MALQPYQSTVLWLAWHFVPLMPQNAYKWERQWREKYSVRIYGPQPEKKSGCRAPPAFVFGIVWSLVFAFWTTTAVMVTGAMAQDDPNLIQWFVLHMLNTFFCKLWTHVFFELEWFVVAALMVVAMLGFQSGSCVVVSYSLRSTPSFWMSLVTTLLVDAWLCVALWYTVAVARGAGENKPKVVVHRPAPRAFA